MQALVFDGRLRYDAAYPLPQAAPGESLVLKSTFHGAQETAFATFVVDEISIVGSRCGPFPPALRLLENKLVDVDSMITAEFPIARGMQAFEHASEKGVRKVLITMDQ